MNTKKRITIHGVLRQQSSMGCGSSRSAEATGGRAHPQNHDAVFSLATHAAMKAAAGGPIPHDACDGRPDRGVNLAGKGDRSDVRNSLLSGGRRRHHHPLFLLKRSGAITMHKFALFSGALLAVSCDYRSSR